jgi:hypothetical protein
MSWPRCITSAQIEQCLYDPAGLRLSADNITVMLSPLRHSPMRRMTLAEMHAADATSTWQEFGGVAYGATATINTVSPCYTSTGQAQISCDATGITVIEPIMQRFDTDYCDDKEVSLYSHTEVDGMMVTRYAGAQSVKTHDVPPPDLREITMWAVLQLPKMPDASFVRWGTNRDTTVAGVELSTSDITLLLLTGTHARALTEIRFFKQVSGNIATAIMKHPDDPEWDTFFVSDGTFSKDTDVRVDAPPAFVVAMHWPLTVTSVCTSNGDRVSLMMAAASAGYWPNSSDCPRCIDGRAL